jgi:transcriptional regulator with XRE-family HTH domain
MPVRLRHAEIGAARGRAAVAEVCREARSARLAHGLSQEHVARALRLSRSQYSRIERGLAPRLSIATAARMLAVLGLDLSVRAYPAGNPIRDAGHGALLGRFHGHLSQRLRWQTEVPSARPGDRRAWDAVVTGSDGHGRWRIGIEAETRPNDAQALERRVALKERDDDVDAVILVLADTRHNRALVRANAGLRDRFPVPGRRALELLAVGARPEGSAIVLL